MVEGTLRSAAQKGGLVWPCGRPIVREMAKRRELDLGTALRLNGAAGDPRRYEAIAVREAPRWMVAVWGRGVAAMTLPHAVYVSDEALAQVLSGAARTLLLHESVHVDQWRHYGRAGFLARYVGDYLKGRAVGLPHHAAYRAIRFERRAVDRSEAQ